jgi:hypothetical protein
MDSSHRVARIIALSVLLLLALESLSLIQWTFYPSADMYYQESIARGIISNGSIPSNDPWVQGGREHAYPPMASVLAAYLMQLTGSDFGAMSRSLPILVLPVYFLLIFSISGFFTKSLRVRLLSALLFSTLPFVGFQYALIYSGPTFGILLSLFTLYAFFRFKERSDSGSLVLLALSASLLILSHFRSAVVTYLIISCISIASRGCSKRLITALALPVLMASPWLLTHLDSIIHMSSPNNPFLPSFGELGIIVILLALVASLVLLVRFRRITGEHLGLVIWVAAPGLLTAMLSLTGSSTFFRNLEYLVFPFMLLFAYLFVSVVSRISSRGLQGACYALFVAFMMIQALGVYMAPPLLERADYDAMLWLSHQGDGVVLADFAHSYAIPDIARKPVVVGAFPESLPDGQERLDDVWGFFKSCDEEVLDRYDVGYIYLGGSESDLLECELAYPSIYDLGGVKILRVY